MRVLEFFDQGNHLVVLSGSADGEAQTALAAVHPVAVADNNAVADKIVIHRIGVADLDKQEVGIGMMHLSHLRHGRQR